MALLLILLLSACGPKNDRTRLDGIEERIARIEAILSPFDSGPSGGEDVVVGGEGPGRLFETFRGDVERIAADDSVKRVRTGLIRRRHVEQPAGRRAPHL